MALAGFTLVRRIVAIATRVVGCALTAWLVGLSRRDAPVVGLGNVHAKNCERSHPLVSLQRITDHLPLTFS